MIAAVVLSCTLQESVTSLVGLDACPLLEDLWVAETALERISGLERCASLSRMFLYSNSIQVIEGLDTLTALEVCLSHSPVCFAGRSMPAHSHAAKSDLGHSLYSRATQSCMQRPSPQNPGQGSSYPKYMQKSQVQRSGFGSVPCPLSHADPQHLTARGRETLAAACRAAQVRTAGHAWRAVAPHHVRLACWNWMARPAHV